MKRFASLVFAAAAAVIPPPAFAHEGMLHEGCPSGQSFAAGEITVTGALGSMARVKAPVGGGYMTISNAGSMPDRLVGATTEATDTVEFHDMKVEAGMMKMVPMPEGIEIPAGGTVSFAPGGLHVMFLNPKAPFKQGECLEVVLQFERAGELPVQLSVGPIGADAPPESHHHH
jgi:periplasmic copper chaperone A